MDYEIHFVTQCRINACERRVFYQKMSFVDPQFTSLNDKEKFIYLMQSNGQETLKWFAIYIIYINNFANGMNSSITLLDNYSLFHGTWYVFGLLSSYASMFDEYTYADMLTHICGGCACTYQYTSIAVHTHVCVQACIYVHIICMHVYAWLFCAYVCLYRVSSMVYFISQFCDGICVDLCAILESYDYVSNQRHIQYPILAMRYP